MAVHFNPLRILQTIAAAGIILHKLAQYSVYVNYAKITGNIIVMFRFYYKQPAKIVNV
jgi:hypothetical protein